MKSNQHPLNRVLVLLLSAGSLHLATPSVQAQDNLARQFLNPPPTARPAVYGFMFAYGGFSEAALARDFEEMKAKGVASCLIYSLGPGAGTIRRGTKLVYGETENRVEKSDEYSGPGALPEDMGPLTLSAWSDPWRKAVRFALFGAGQRGLHAGGSLDWPAGKDKRLLGEFSGQALEITADAADAHAQFQAEASGLFGAGCSATPFCPRKSA